MATKVYVSCTVSTRSLIYKNYQVQIRNLFQQNVQLAKEVEFFPTKDMQTPNPFRSGKMPTVLNQMKNHISDFSDFLFLSYG